MFKTILCGPTVRSLRRLGPSVLASWPLRRPPDPSVQPVRNRFLLPRKDAPLRSSPSSRSFLLWADRTPSGPLRGPPGSYGTLPPGAAMAHGPWPMALWSPPTASPSARVRGYGLYVPSPLWQGLPLRRGLASPFPSGMGPLGVPSGLLRIPSGTTIPCGGLGSSKEG